MEMNRIAILTDSTCDLPDALIDQYDIRVIPHIVIWGDKQYRDRVDIQSAEFYQRLTRDPQRPTSSQAGIPDFVQAYEQAASRGAKEIIILTVSSAMSGAFQMAKNAASLVKIPVRVVDSKGPTMTLGWQVLAAARACAAGLDLQGVLDAVENVRKSLVQFVAMDTLEYLQKGGRIGNAVKWVGGLLQVKPLVSINHQTGLVEPEGLARTHRGLVKMLYTKFFASLKGSQNLHVAVLHGNAQEEAEALAGRIADEYHPSELLINMTGPVLGINTGPGALALCGYAED